jgi:alpha-L-fucosidase
MNRRHFLNRSAAATGGLVLGRHLAAAEAGTGPSSPIPAWLAGDPEAYANDPRAAAIDWMRRAKYGLFLHYGLYSLEGRHEWLQLREKIPVATYARLKDRFTAEKFDAGAIAAMAADAGMRYINITTRHHDSFCLFKTARTGFNSTTSPAKRDLVLELAEACRKHRLGLSLYYSHGRDWRHPHAPNNDRYGGSARPAYNPPEPAYACGADHDLNKYLDFMTAQITELLTQYGPVMAIWLDGIATPLQKKDRNGKVVKSQPNRPGNAPEFRCQELYAHIHALQPQVLVSYKQGLLGTEDFFAPEHKSIENPGNKPMEICSTLQKGSWGFKKGAPRLTPDEAWQKLVEARQAGANLLLNTGPLPDGSIDATDAATLRAVGARLRKEGFPGT